MPVASRRHAAVQWHAMSVKNVLDRPIARKLTSGRTIMLVTAGLWIAATGVVALSFECVGAAVVFFGRRSD